MAVGAHLGRSLVSDEDANGVINGLDFLRSVVVGSPVKVGKKVFVIEVELMLPSLPLGKAWYREVHMVCLESGTRCLLTNGK